MMLTAVLFSATSCLSAPGNPLGLPSYEQRIALSFASEADARRATCRIAPLPDNARLSFGTRWDDTNPNDVPKAKMLNEAGAKASFYLVGGSAELVGSLAPQLLALGHAVGNHTMSHPYVLQLSPNAFFRQVLETRMRVETAVGRTINSYVGPFGWQWNDADVTQAPLYARILVETGHYVSGDNPRPQLGLPRDVWYPAHRFSADDRNPSAELFRKNSEAMLKEALADRLSPRLTLGTHAWCKDAGNEIQRREIVRLCEGKDWVHQTDWDFGAYRYEAINGRVEKKGGEGTKAVFVVTRFAPSSLAADVPLSLLVEPTPVGGLPAGARGTWHLPHETGRAIVTAVDVAAADGSSKMFSGVQLTVAVKPEANEGELVLVNGGKTPLASGFAVYYAAPVWKTHRHVASFPSLAPGETFRKTFSLGERDRADYAEDAAFVAGSADFSLGERFCRLWATSESPGCGLGFPAPRDTSLSSRFLAQPLDAAAVSAASVPGAPLPAGLDWKNRLPKGVGLGCHVIACSARTPSDVEKEKGPLTRYFAWDFEAKADGKVRFFSDVAGGWCANGRGGRFKGASAEVDVKAGANRIIVWDVRKPSKYLPVITLRKVVD